MNRIQLSDEMAHKPADAPSIPYGLVLCGAARRLAHVSYREFCTDPRATAKSYLCAYEKYGGSIPAWTDLSIEAADFGQKMIYPEESTATVLEATESLLEKKQGGK